MKDRKGQPGGRTARSETQTFAVLFLMSAMLAPLAFGAADILAIDLLALLNFSPETAALGVVATVPMLALLHWFMAAKHEKIERFRASQIEYFAQIGFRFTPLRIVLISLAAGIGEELLFRGVFQTLADRHMSSIAAIIATNAVFGLLHARSLAYALIAGLVGAYLGALFRLTASLAVPMIAHALYDVAALAVTEREIQRRRLAVR
jgi:hypothetical protein